MKHLIAAAILYAQVAPASASEGSLQQCEILAPVAISGWLAVLDDLQAASRHEVAATSQRLVASVGLYRELGCDVVALQSAVSCVTKALGAGVPALEVPAMAENCLAQSALLASG
jgi:hypothetical protein